MRDPRYLIASIVCALIAGCLLVLMITTGCSPREWWHLWNGEIVETPGLGIKISNESSEGLDYDDLLAIDAAYARELECWWSSQGTGQYVSPDDFVLVFVEPNYSSPVLYGCPEMEMYPGYRGRYFHNLTGTDDVIYTTICGIDAGVLQHEFGHYICWSLRGPLAFECGDQDRTHRDFYKERNGCEPRG